MRINQPETATILIIGRQFVDNNPNRSTNQKANSIRNRMEQLWLTYYNDTLYEKGVITEDERNKMRIKIKSHARQMER